MKRSPCVYLFRRSNSFCATIPISIVHAKGLSLIFMKCAVSPVRYFPCLMAHWSRSAAGNPLMYCVLTHRFALIRSERRCHNASTTFPHFWNLPVLPAELFPIFDICIISVPGWSPFSRTKTGLLIVVLTFLQILFGLLARFSTGNISAILSLISTLSYAIFYFAAIRKSPGQLLFVLLMISNIANLTVITAKCLEGQFFPDFALLPYRYSMSLFMVIAEIFILIPIFVFLKKWSLLRFPAHSLFMSGVISGWSRQPFTWSGIIWSMAIRLYPGLRSH